MKKTLSLLGTITLIGTSTTSLISCNGEKILTQKTDDIGDWKGVQLYVNYFIQEKNDNKYYSISYFKIDEKKWTNWLVKNDGINSKNPLDRNYKIWQWKLETVPTLPKIDDKGNIII